MFHVAPLVLHTTCHFSLVLLCCRCAARSCCCVVLHVPFRCRPDPLVGPSGPPRLRRDENKQRDDTAASVADQPGRATPHAHQNKIKLDHIPSLSCIAGVVSSFQSPGVSWRVPGRPGVRSFSPSSYPGRPPRALPLAPLPVFSDLLHQPQLNSSHTCAPWE